MYAQPVMASGIAPNVCTASTGVEDCSKARSSVKQRTELSAECRRKWKAPSNFLHSSLRNTWVPQKVAEDSNHTGDDAVSTGQYWSYEITNDRYFPHLQDDAVQEEPLLDHERERIKDRSKRR